MFTRNLKKNLASCGQQEASVWYSFQCIYGRSNKLETHYVFLALFWLKNTIFFLLLILRIFVADVCKKKMDGVGPFVTDPATTSSTNLYPPQKIYKIVFWHVTQDTLHMTKGGLSIVLKFQVPSSNSLGVLMSYDTWHIYMWHGIRDM